MCRIVAAAGNDEDEEPQNFIFIFWGIFLNF